MRKILIAALAALSLSACGQPVEVLEALAANGATKWIPFRALDTIGLNTSIFSEK